MVRAAYGEAARAQIRDSVHWKGGLLGCHFGELPARGGHEVPCSIASLIFNGQNGAKAAIVMTWPGAMSEVKQSIKAASGTSSRSVPWLNRSAKCSVA